MKALYTIIDSTLYQVDQIVRTPYVIGKDMDNSSSLRYDEGRRRVSLQVWLDSFDQTRVKTNKAMYYEMIEALKENEITEIPPMQNTFKMTVDYTLSVKNGKEIDHSITVQTIKPIDAILPLGVAKNNELVYRFVKMFKKKIDFRFKDNIPYGIMKQPYEKYILTINNISIYEDTNTIEEIHKSLEERPFKYGSQTVESSLEFTKLVFSSMDAGISYYPVELSYIPRVINFDMEILLDNYIVAYDDNEVNKVLVENIKLQQIPEIIDPDTGEDEKEERPTPPEKEPEVAPDYEIDPGPELCPIPPEKPDKPCPPKPPKPEHRPPCLPPDIPRVDHEDHKDYVDDWGDVICPEDMEKNWRPPCHPPEKPDHKPSFKPHKKPDRRPPRPHFPGPEGPLPEKPGEGEVIYPKKFFYERSTFDKPHTLLVVADDYPKDLFRDDVMVYKKEVIGDIPNITIGDYVRRIKIQDDDGRSDPPRPDIPPRKPYPHKPSKR